MVAEFIEDDGRPADPEPAAAEGRLDSSDRESDLNAQEWEASTGDLDAGAVDEALAAEEGSPAGTTGTAMSRTGDGQPRDKFLRRRPLRRDPRAAG